MRHNDLGQPIGAPLPDWHAPPLPRAVSLGGRYGRLTPLTTAHAPALHEAFSHDEAGQLWTYLPYGPFGSADEIAQQIAYLQSRTDMLFFAVEDTSGQPCGFASYLRIAPDAGSIEVGNVCFAPRLQRTTLATEAMYLMMDHAFSLGYRRYEWKCDALNQPSRNAAERLGFQFEGVFRQATIYKGRNRDTAWYAVIDTDWPALRAALTSWLSPDNFNDDGRQRRALSTLRRHE